MRIIVSVITLTTLSASPAWASNDALNVQQQGNISYVSGGIGTDESDALQAVKADYNLRVMNADKSGHFSGDTRLIISDSHHNILLDATSGPLFYANLPAGRYIVEGVSDGQSKKQVIRIAGRNPVNIRFVWPEDAIDINSY